MRFSTTFLSFAGVSWVVSIPLEHRIAAPTSTLKFENLVIRDVMGLPTSNIQCANGTENGQPFPSKTFNDFQISDAVQKGLNNLANNITNGKIIQSLRSSDAAVHSRV